MMTGKERLERQKERKLRCCRHFNGLMNETCNAEIPYKDVRSSDSGILEAFQTELIMPCWGKCEKKCQKYATFTKEEIEKEEAETKRKQDLIFKQGLSPCCEKPINETHVITSGRHKGHGPRFCSECGELVYMV